jgi:hypothetical protein
MKTIISLLVLALATPAHAERWVLEWQCDQTVVRLHLGDPKTEKTFKVELEAPPKENFEFHWEPDGTKRSYQARNAVRRVVPATSTTSSVRRPTNGKVPAGLALNV